MKHKKYNYIIIDLDGTILDDKYRQYKCYQDILLSFGDLPIDINLFWNMKRKKTQWSIILGYTRSQCKEKRFIEEWIKRIEDDVYLNYSVLKKDAETVLFYLSEIGNHVILATNRRNKNTFFNQIDCLGIRSFFNDISIGSEQKVSRRMLSNLEGRVLVIGDTEEDELLAKSHGYEFVAVTSGIREKNLIKGAYYIDELIEIKDII